MNIQFNTLEIDDFQSIGHAKINLDNKGVVLVKGINNYEENTNSNGSGKSSIFEALYFSLFGKTTTGITNVTNRYSGAKSYKLKLNFSIDNVNYEIFRDGTKVTLLENDNDISRRNKSDTDTYIRDNILKISPDIFLNIIYLSQGFKSRLSALTAGGRKDQIEEIIGTSEITENFRLKVQELKENLNNELLEKEKTLSYNEGNLNEINRNIENYQNEINRINQENASKPSKDLLLSNLNKVKEDLQKEEDNQKLINEKISKIKEENSSKEIEIAKIDNELTSIKLSNSNQQSQLLLSFENFKKERDLEISKIEQSSNLEIAEINKNISIINTQNNNLNQQILKNKSDIETLKTSDTCPTCGRKFDNFNQEHLINEIQKLINSNLESEKILNENNIKVQEYNNQLTIIKENNNKEILKIQDEVNQKQIEQQKQISTLTQELTKNLSEKQAQKDKILETINNMVQENQELLESSTKISTYKSNIILLENQINNLIIESTEQYEKLINECNKNIIKINKEKDILEKEKSVLEEEIGIATHSISLISKEFKNYLLKSAIDFLNSRLEYYSSMLFSNENDKIKFVQDGTKLDIYLGDALFESLSGGEKRKVDIAIMIVQKELANNMSNTYSNTLIMDEIFDGLDSKAIDIVTEILLQVSKDVNSMFVVSHKDTTIGYDGQIIVTKGKDRVSTVVQQ